METLKFALDIFLKLADKFGSVIAILAVMVFGFWKLGSNHLFHLKLDLQKIDKKIDRNNQVNEKNYKEIKKELSNIDKKIAVSNAVCAERHKK
jgi:hypothetical protein